MQQLLPEHRILDVEELYLGLTLPTGRHRPHVALGMVATLDGAAALDGDTSRLGQEADGIAFRRLRGAADAILVGAGTVRAENYGPPKATATRRADRTARGLAERPRMVVVTGSLSLEPDHRLFGDPASRPVVLTHEGAPAAAANALSPIADVVRVGDGDVDLGAGLVHLAGIGIRHVLCEGGPTLNGSLLAADLVDEVFVTVSPLAAGGPASRIIASEESGRPRSFVVTSLHEHRDELIIRYSRDR